MIQTIQELLEPASKIEVLDVGAAVFADDPPPYKPLLDAGVAHFNGFDGDARQVPLIRASYGADANVFNEFLFDGTLQTIYVTSPESGMTSLLKPDIAALKFFGGFESIGRVLKTETVQTTRLDDVSGLPDIDMLKIDAQGSELTVMRNGVEKLRNCLAIQLEVSYFPLYENQPCFGEIDVWMRAQGFSVHCFMGIKRWPISPTVFKGNDPGHQLLESDLVYVRNPLKLHTLSDEQLKKLILITHYSYWSYDLSVHFLLELVKRGVLAASSHEEYIRLIRVGQSA